MGDEIACYIASDSGILKYFTSGSGLAYRRLWKSPDGIGVARGKLESYVAH
jgi:hypothetical protein